MPDADKRRRAKTAKKAPTVAPNVAEDPASTIDPSDGSNAGESNGEAEKKRPGPKKGSANHFTHGLTANRHGLKAGKLPKDAKYIETRLNIFRRELEAAVLSAKGEVNLADAASVQTCIRWERHAMLAQRWLTKQYDELKPADRLNFSREIARASGERDKAIKALALDSHEADELIVKLYGPNK